MTIPEKKNLNNESNRDGLARKLLLTSLGAWFLGKEVDVKLHGSQNEIKIISNALLASKGLHEELNSSEVTVESAMEKLRSKKIAAEEFEKTFGVSWPL